MGYVTIDKGGTILRGKRFETRIIRMPAFKTTPKSLFMSVIHSAVC